MLKTASNTGRIQKWDILKFFLIFLVVLGHFVEVYMSASVNLKILRFWIYSFHMPLFIFITGLFAKRNINEKRYSKIASFLLIYFVSDFLVVLSNAVFITGKIKYSLTTVNSAPWYAFVVFFYCLITIAVRKIPKAYVFVFAVVLACFAGYSGDLGDTLALSRMICFYPFFFAGYCFDAGKLGEALSKPAIKIFSAAFLSAYSLLLFFKFNLFRPYQSLLSGKHPYEYAAAVGRFGGLYRLAWYALAFMLCFCIISLAPNRLGKKGFVALLGSRTLQVYVLHLVFLKFITNAFDLKTLLAHTSNLLLIPVSLAVTLLCSAKIFEKPIAYLTNPQSFIRKKAACEAKKIERENENES